MAAITGLLAGKTTLQNAQTGNANGNTFDCTKFGLLVVYAKAASNWDGTLNFEADVDGTNYVSVQGENVASGVLGTTASGTTLSAAFRFDVSGLNTFRARTSSASTGSVTVTARGVPA